MPLRGISAQIAALRCILLLPPPSVPVPTTTAPSCPPLSEVHCTGRRGYGDKSVGSDRNGDFARVLGDLLKVVKVAMPPELFAVDPRIIRARKLLAELSEISSGRPPSTIRSSAGELVELAFSDVPLDLLTAEPEPQWDITLGIDRFMASGLAPVDRREAVEQIIREWLSANGYLQLPPEETN